MIDKIWSGKSKLYWILLPLSLLYGLISHVRRLLYRYGIFSSWRSPVPVLVVGNLTAGGNGKTPMVIWLVEHLAQKGIKAGVVSRGYGGRAQRYPLLLDSQTQTQEAGDEPVLIYQRLTIPVAVAANRSLAIQALLNAYSVDIIITDDGLQHYALQRDIELVVIDGERRFGNGWWLPAGPMRERSGRLASVDAIIVNGGEPEGQSIPMTLVADKAINLLTGEIRAVNRLPNIIAMAGIGYPPRFFNTLTELGAIIEKRHSFADHQPYRLEQLAPLASNQQSLLMTEKDAIKCREFAQENWWYLPVNAEIAKPYADRLLAKIERVLNDKKDHNSQRK